MNHLIKAASIIILFAHSILAIGQNRIPEFGVITKNEIDMKTYSPDPKTEAVVIHSIGDSKFVENSFGQFEVRFSKRVRIKIFNKNGYSFGEVAIPFYTSNDLKERVSIKNAATFNMENGNMVRTDLDPKAVFVEKVSESWKSLKFALPNIKDGSIIEYEYEFVTDYKTTLPVWNFQMTIPVIYSEYTLRMIPYYQYRFILLGTNKFTSQKSYQGTDIKYYGERSYYDMVYQFVMSDMPAFRDEAYITSINDYLIKIEFQLSKVIRPDRIVADVISTWPTLNEDLLKSSLFGKYINSSEKVAENFLKGIDLSGLNDLEKIEMVSERIKRSFKWNGSESIYASKTPKELIEQKEGNCTDINLFLLACLRSLGLEAYPVLLSTRDNGKIKTDYPFLSFLNYTIVTAKTKEKQLLLDATNIFLPFDKIPINCINESGIIVQKTKEEWVVLSSTDQGSSIAETFSISADPGKDSLECSMEIISTGYYASEMKERTGIKYEKIKEDLISRGLNPLDSIRIENFAERKKDYGLAFDTHQRMERIENRILISPFFQEAEQSNKLKSPARKYPVDFIYKKNRQFVSTIKIPEGYKVVYVPSEYFIDNDLINILYTTNIKDNILTVTGKYNFKKSVYDPKDYVSIKGYLSEIVKRFNDKILFEK